MQPFRVHTGLSVALDRANVDTDQIIPKQFLKRVERTGFGQFLFFDWRFNPDGSSKKDFVLNDPRFRAASILVAGPNFGCGSSREHAPWALADYGFRAIIAPSFADIFASNSAKNGLLLCTVPEEVVTDLTNRCRDAGCELKIDLENCEIRSSAGLRAAFYIDPFRRECLLNGWDDIGLTMRYENDISRYEQSHVTRRTFECA